MSYPRTLMTFVLRNVSAAAKRVFLIWDAVLDFGAALSVEKNDYFVACNACMYAGANVLQSRIL